MSQRLFAHPMVPFLVESGIAYGLSAALIWGCYLFVFKRHFSDYPASVVIVVTNAFAIGWLFLAIAIDMPAIEPMNSPDISAFESVLASVTVLLFALGLLSFYRALTIGDVSYVAPISKVSPAFVLPLEIILLSEQLSIMQVVGVGFATVAVYLANFRGGGLAAPLLKTVTHRPAQLALTSAALMAFVALLQRVLLQEVGLQVLTWVLVKLAGVGLVLAPLAYRSWPAMTRRFLPKFAVAGAIVGLGEYVTALAYADMPASLASPLVSTQAVVAVVLGGLLLDEQAFRLRLIAAGIAILGIVLIGLP